MLNLTVSETDYPSVKVGEQRHRDVRGAAEPGVSVRDGLGRREPHDDAGCGDVPGEGAHRERRCRGVGARRTPPAAAAGAARNGRGGARRAAAQADATPQANSTPRRRHARCRRAGRWHGQPGAARVAAAGRQQGAAAAPTGKPAPGMNATVTIVVDQRTNVDNGAIEGGADERARRATSTVKNDDGTTQDVTVSTGLSDATNTEITSGLDDGQTIEIPGKARRRRARARRCRRRATRAVAEASASAAVAVAAPAVAEAAAPRPAAAEATDDPARAT